MIPDEKLTSDAAAPQPVDMDSKSHIGETQSRSSSPTLNKEKAEASEPVQQAYSEDVEPTYVTGTKLVLVLIGLTIVMLLSMLDISIVGTAIPQITSDFHRLEHVGWYIAAYQLASATVQPLSGKMYTYFSTKWTYLVFFVIFEIGSVICGAAQSSIMLIIGRSIAGLGASGLTNGTITIIVGAFAPERRPLYTSVAMGLGQIGIVLGPILGGIFTQYASWRWCFYINLPLGGIGGAFLAMISIPDHAPKSRVTKAFLREILPKLDLIGFALFAPAAIMLLLALQFGSAEYGWSSSQAIGLFCGGGVTAILFVFWENHVGDDAMIPLGLVKKRVMWASSLNFAFLMASIIVAGNFFPIFFQSVKGLSPTMSGVYMLPSVLSQITFIIASGALMRKLGYYLPWAVLASCAAALACGLITIWTPSTGLGEIIGFQLILGIRGAGIQIGVIALQTLLKPHELAIGNSVLIFAQNLFGAIFVTLANTIFQELLIANIPSYISHEAAIAAGGSSGAVRALARNPSELEPILWAYTKGFRGVFYMLIGTSIAALVMSFNMGWVDLRAKKKPEKEEV